MDDVWKKIPSGWLFCPDTADDLGGEIARLSRDTFGRAGLALRIRLQNPLEALLDGSGSISVAFKGLGARTANQSCSSFLIPRFAWVFPRWTRCFSSAGFSPLRPRFRPEYLP
jgi:hypothetical protein